jgi:hypothetical protein
LGARKIKQKVKVPVFAIGVLTDPLEIVYMAVYLASDEVRGVTGQAMNVCGETVLF